MKVTGVCHSYSRPRVPKDNAVAESFFSTLKHEGIFLNGYPKSLRELKLQVVEFIEQYNTKRPHEHPGQIAPDEYEKRLKFGS